MNRLKKLEDEISAWYEASIHPYRFEDRQCPFGNVQRKDQCAHSGRSRTGMYSGRYLRRTPLGFPVAAFVNSTLSS